MPAPTQSASGTAGPPPSPAGCTLAQYAASKKLREAFLKSLGLRDITYQGASAVRIPYRAADGSEVAVQFRTELQRTGTGDPFKWKAGCKPTVYGLERIELAKAVGSVTIVEGPSDAQTLWHHQYPALGLPSARWDEKWTNYLDGIQTIYVVIEPDAAGQKLRRAFEQASVNKRVRFVDLGALKDPSGLYLDEPAAFDTRWKAALAAATPWTDLAEQENRKAAAAARQRCGTLATQADVLGAFAASIRGRGVVGEEKAAVLLYLAVTSRLSDRIVSVAVKGPSSGGKSFLTDRVLEYFPNSAFVKLSGMSQRALAYDEQTSLSHRMLVIAEAAGAEGGYSNYLLRTLLSEGHLIYTTVEKTSEGLRSRTIRREGPTGLIVTTTAVSLHPENETRLLSVTVTDTPQQTREILLTTGGRRQRPPVPEEWHALQEWIARSDNRVVVPFGERLASLIPPVATRLRRDFGIVLTLIEAHALLHQGTRTRDQEGRLVATDADYAAVRLLTAELLSEGVGTTVPPLVRATVEAVRRIEAGGNGVSLHALAKDLKIDESTASRRAARAEHLGYINSDKEGRNKKLFIGTPLPIDATLLPDVSELFPSTSVRPPVTEITVAVACSDAVDDVINFEDLFPDLNIVP